jgi:hypothetical protein
MASILGQQERFELAEAQCGFMPLIILAASFRNSSAAVMHVIILQNTSRLLQRYPLLTASVADMLTQRPRWRWSEARSSLCSVVHLEPTIAATPEDVVREEERKGLLFDLDQGPLWRVGIYNTTALDGCFVVLTVSHIIMDGSGALEFLRFLLQEAVLDSTYELLSAPPPRAEDTMNMSPTYTEAASAIAQEILFNSLPSFLKGIAGKAPSWPTADMLRERSLECTARRHQLAFGNTAHSLVGGLKSFGKLSGSGSMQSLIHTACMIAILSASAKSDSHKSESTNLTSKTPIALRDTALGHPPIIGITRH